MFKVHKISLFNNNNKKNKTFNYFFNNPNNKNL